MSTTPTTEDPWADLPAPAPEASYDGHDDGPDLTAEEIEDLTGPLSDEAITGSLVVAGEDLLLADPARLRAVVAAVRVGLLARVREAHAHVAQHRTQAGPRPAPSDLLGEAQVMTRAHESLSTLGKAFTEIAREPAALMVDAMQDHLGPARRSMKVGTPDGAEVAVSLASASSKVSVDEAEVLDVLGTSLLAGVAVGPDVYASEYTDPTYAAGVRDGIAALRRLLGTSPGWKSTALEGLVRQLETADEGALAARLSGAFARVESGEPTPKLTITYGG